MGEIRFMRLALNSTHKFLTKPNKNLLNFQALSVETFYGFT